MEGGVLQRSYGASRAPGILTAVAPTGRDPAGTFNRPHFMGGNTLHTNDPLRRRVVALSAAAILFVMATSSLAAEVVELPADPPARRTAALEEVWRVGGEEDDEILLGFVTGGTLDGDGNVLLIDRQLSQVLVISPDGELVATLGREGDGPGEMRRPHSIFVADDRIGIVQGFPGKVVFLDFEGLPAGEMRIGGEAAEGGFHFTRGLRCVGDDLVVQSGRSTFDRDSGKRSSHNSLAVMAMDGTVKATLVEHDDEASMDRFVFDEAANWAEYDSWAASSQGLVVTTAERDAWALNVRDLAGNHLRTLRRPFETRKRTSEDKDEVASGMRVVINGRRQEIENKALDTDPAIADLQAAADGRFFVTTCWHEDERLDTGVAACFEVIDPEGAFVEELTLTFPDHDPTMDRLLFLDGVHFLVLRNFEDARDAMRAGFDDDEEDEEDLGDVEPLEVVLVRMPG